MLPITVIIPALNEEAAIATVVTSAQGWVNDLIVVDNGSSDATAERAAAAGARVVREAQRGYGAACWAGVLATREECILVFMDGDGSFAAAEIARLVAPIQENRADLVLGARELSGVSEAMPQHARFGNSLATRLLRLLYGLQVSDLGPFRAIRRQLLLDLHMREMVFGWPVEMMVKAARQGYRICEVPVSYRPRLGGESKVSGNLRGTLRAGYRILAVIFTYAQPWSKL